MKPTLSRCLIVAALCASSCARQYPYTWVGELPKAFAEEGVYRIQPGDRITVQVADQQQLSGEFEVRANGAYLQPLVGELVVVGLTTEAAADRLRARLQGIVVNPTVELSVSSPRTLAISVLGEVRTPGIVALPLGDGLLTALARAGGLTEFASRDGIYVLRSQPNRARIRFRYDALTGGDEASVSFKLRDHDVVVVE